ncbi:MFS transporter [Desulfuromonas versatilis]|nr:MFS transporter [Desulfuromonas versatilis]
MLYTPAFWAMFVANLSNVASFGAYFLFPLYVSGHGGSKGDIGVVMGIFALASAACRPWVAEMIDRLGRKRSFTLGSLGMTLLPLAYLPFSGDLQDFYLPLLAVRAAHGVALAICFTAVFTYVADIIPGERINEGIGMFGISGLVGMALGPVLGEWSINLGGGFTPFFLLSAALAGLGLLSHLPLAETGTGRGNIHGPSFFTLLSRRKLAVVGLLSLIFGIGLAATGNFVTPLAQQRQIPFISLYYLLYSVAAVLVRFVGGRLADRVGENRMLPYALVVTAAGSFCLITVAGSPSLGLAGLVAGAGHGLLFPILNTLAIRNEPAEIRGKVTGIFTGGIDSGAFVGSLILGYVGELAGFGALFTVSGLVVLSGLAIFRFRPGGLERGQGISPRVAPK